MKKQANNAYKENLEIGIGLNEVDNLKPSSYFYEVIHNSNSYAEIHSKLETYYKDKELNNEILRQKECDLVANNIAQLLNEQSFTFSHIMLKNIHRKLFSGVFEGRLKKFVGIFRTYNIEKSEDLLNGRSVIYSDYGEIEECLAYDFDQERKKNYAALSMNERIKSITRFIANIWQVHPFCEGNTRTIAIFAIKFLRSKNIDINNEIFKEHSLYFRNALVLANFSDMKLGIDYDSSYLQSFFEKFIVNRDLELKKMPSNIIQETKNQY